MNRTVAELAHRWLGRRRETLSSAENRVLESAVERRTVARDVNAAVSDQARLGDRLADRIARIGGSWSFILGFIAFLAFWTAGNTLLLGRDVFDPYPFIFLNLVLSMVAALQAPIIMMAQNRQAARDRIDAAHDYEVNLKAEIEILALHEKLDDLRRTEIALLREDVALLTAELRAARDLLDARGAPGAGPSA
ncbi:DUF1003 domain-containing protein [Aquibium microcysteis]|uniref:DUF1003 domain-containing protein n=1 Tax=Aquibium microcysteis TaxID=675281 RepID=UPI00165D0F71|nr:DUF1003 domain-containing protein [Aquibium microcysteis]